MIAKSPLSDLSTEDRKRFYSITLGFMCVAAAALIGRTVGDALFLEAYSASDLAYMYPATALTVCLVSYGYARLASRIPLGRLVATLSGCLAAVSVLLRIVLEISTIPYTRVAAYVLGDLVVNLPMVLFWSFAAQCFAPGQAKRLFGLVGAGGTTACIVSGFFVRPFADAFGPENLLLIITGLMVAFAVVISRTSRRDSIGRQRPDAGQGDAGIGSLGNLLGQRQIQAIIGLMLTSTVALTLVDYQFKAGARLNLQTEELAGFFGTFYGVTSAVALVIQLFLVHRVLQKGGVFAGLIVMPVAVLAASVATWVTEAFGWTVATKAVVQVFAFTIDSAALQMLYLGIARQTRSQARAVAEGIAKPLSTGLTGLALIAGATMSGLHELAMLAAICAFAWSVLTRINHTAYIGALADSLGNQKFDASQETLALHDSALETHLRESLSTANDEEIVYLLGILPSLEEVDWTDDYRKLLGRRDPRVKVAALSYLQEQGDEEDSPDVIPLLEHPEAAVRAAAIDALQAIGNPEHVALIEQYLEDPSSETRAAAVAALIKSEDLDHLLSAGTILRALLDSESPQDRIAAAHALGRLRRGGLVRPLIALLQDDDTSVLRAAIDACEKQTDPKLIPAIVPLLANPRVAAIAGDVLVAFGEPALDHLIPYLELADEEGAFGGAQGIPMVLSRIGSLDVLPAIRKASTSANPSLRANAIQAYGDLILDHEVVREHKGDIQHTLLGELKASRLNRARARRFASEPHCEILSSALIQVADSYRLNAFRLLDVLSPSVRMTTLLPSLLRPGDARNNGLEVLENVLRGDIRSETVAAVREEDPPLAGEARQILEEILQEGCADWVRVGALYALGRVKETSHDLLEPDLRHSHAIVRETALEAVAEVAPIRARNNATHLLEDDALIVRTLAKDILEGSEEVGSP